MAVSSSWRESQPNTRLSINSVLYRPIVLSFRELLWAVPIRPTEPARPRSSSFSVKVREVYGAPVVVVGIPTPVSSGLGWPSSSLVDILERPEEHLSAVLSSGLFEPGREATRRYEDHR